MTIQIKDALKTVGGISTSGAITTTGNGNHSIGSTSNRFNSIIGTNIYVYDANAQHYASLRTTTVGTTDTQGVGRLVAGNNVNAGTAGNAKGQILLYGTNTGYTALSPSNNTTSNVTVELPSAAGKIPIMIADSNNYWGILPPTGSTDTWLRSPKSGLLPYEKNSTSSSIGTSAWPFNNVYGRYFGIYDTNGQTYGAVRLQTDGTADTQGETRITIGNSIATGNAKNSYGRICMYGKGAGYTYITPGNNGDSGITLTLPSSGGTLARTADIDSKVANYLPLAGGTMTGPIKSSSMATTWVAACNGKAIINSTLSPGSFSPIASAGTTNGRMTLAWYNAELNVAYLTKANCDANTNTVGKLGTLMNESGGAYWPGTVEANILKAKTFEGERANLTGNGPQLALKATSSNNYATMQFLNTSGASMGFIGMSAVNGGLYRWKADASQARAIIDEDTWSWALPSPTSGAYWQGIMKVNGDGVMEAGKYLDFHNTGNTSNDYDVRLQSNGAYKNTVYLPTGSGDLAILQHTNSYWGLMTPAGNNVDWIRTTQNGMIPYQSNSTEGHGSLGTETWPFNQVWAKHIRSKSYMTIQNCPLSIQSGAPSCGGVWIQI